MEPLKCNEGGEFLCPFCGFNFTHHGKVEVFGRDEDDMNPNHVTVDGYEVKIDRDNINNPSSRRGGIKIRFWCEGCSHVYYLTFAQHKGNTIISVEETFEKFNTKV